MPNTLFFKYNGSVGALDLNGLLLDRLLNTKVRYEISIKKLCSQSLQNGDKVNAWLLSLGASDRNLVLQFPIEVKLATTIVVFRKYMLTLYQPSG